MKNMTTVAMVLCGISTIIAILRGDFGEFLGWASATAGWFTVWTMENGR